MPIHVTPDLLHVACPSGKYLKFVYPEPQTEEHLFELPVSACGFDLANKTFMTDTSLPSKVNYRPPSWMGPAISLSSHVYNADPSLPLMNTHLNVSKVSLLVAITCLARRDNNLSLHVKYRESHSSNSAMAAVPGNGHMFVCIPNIC